MFRELYLGVLSSFDSNLSALSGLFSAYFSVDWYCKHSHFEITTENISSTLLGYLLRPVKLVKNEV